LHESVVEKRRFLVLKFDDVAKPGTAVDPTGAGDSTI